jgi:hypothetical protein
MYIKVKRLKQMVEGGKSYNDYLDEQRKYGQDGNQQQNQSSDDSDAGDEATEETNDEFKETFRKAVAAGLISKTADPAEVMRKVLQYKAANPSTTPPSQQPQTISTNDLVQHQAPAPVKSKRIAFLPDCGDQDTRRFFYQDLSNLFSDYSKGQNDSNNNDADDRKADVTFDILPMPYVYEMNTKRFETKWMEYMRGLDLGGGYDVVVAHSSSAEALLRYLESETVAVCVLIDGSDIYTAGERHGRAYRYSLIRDHCQSVRIVSVTAKGATEATTLQAELRCRTRDRSQVAVGEEEGSYATAKAVFAAIMEDVHAPPILVPVVDI